MGKEVCTKTEYGGMEKGGTSKVVMVKDSTLTWQVILSPPHHTHTHTHTTHTQHLEAMKSVDSLYGQALALANIAKTYEYMANLSKACETLELVSTMAIWISGTPSFFYLLFPPFLPAPVKSLSPKLLLSMNLSSFFLPLPPPPPSGFRTGFCLVCTNPLNLFFL